MSIRGEMSKPYAVYVVTESGKEIEIANGCGNLFLKPSSLDKADLNWNINGSVYGSIEREDTTDASRWFNSIFNKTPDLTHNNFSKLLLSQTKEVQARTHKKQRINKKWLKKYGYKTITTKYEFDMEYGSFEHTETDIEYNMTLKNPKEVK